MWTSFHGSSSEEPPTPEQVEQVEQWQRRMSPPENEFPAGVGMTVLLGRTGDAAVGLSQVEAFSTAFRFTLAVRLRQARPQSRTVLDGAVIRAAASHSQVLWPPQPAVEFREPPPAPRPSSGWFADPPD